jgi:hypothetical protein
MNPATIKITHGLNNVFADLGFAPAEAENLRIRADLMLASRGRIQTAEGVDKRNGSIEIPTMSYQDR